MELDAQGYAIRQLIVDKYSTIHLSCREDCLAEGNVFNMDIGGEVRDISRKLFEEKWSLAILPYKVEWIQTKKKYLIGSNLEKWGEFVTRRNLKEEDGLNDEIMDMVKRDISWACIEKNLNVQGFLPLCLKFIKADTFLVRG